MLALYIKMIQISSSNTIYLHIV